MGSDCLGNVNVQRKYRSESSSSRFKIFFSFLLNRIKSKPDEAVFIFSNFLSSSHFIFYRVATHNMQLCISYSSACKRVVERKDMFTTNTMFTQKQHGSQLNCLDCTLYCRIYLVLGRTPISYRLRVSIFKYKDWSSCCTFRNVFVLIF